MTGRITTQLHDDVLVILSNNPPVDAQRIDLNLSLPRRRPGPSSAT